MKYFKEIMAQMRVIQYKIAESRYEIMVREMHAF
jgi:hypothetical protein